jgi:ssRNA-specific RNase YbeY (16S rRNA maturation enzyme)
MPTKEQIEKIVTELQKIMRIQDWDVSIEIVNDREMDSIAKSDYIPRGYCHRNRHYKTAKISLNKDDEDFEKDWYYVLIHELYHVVFEDSDHFWDNEVKHAIEENRFLELEKKRDFYVERLNCDLTRQFLTLYPASNFDHILKEEKA